MRILTLAIYSLFLGICAHADVENFAPVALKCPKGANGTMELVLQNGAGESQRVTSDWDAKGIAHVKVEKRRGNQKYETAMEFNLRSPLNERDQGFADKIVLTTDGYLEHCRDGKVLQAFEREMGRNRRALKRTATEEHADVSEESHEVSGE